MGKEPVAYRRSISYIILLLLFAFEAERLLSQDSRNFKCRVRKMKNWTYGQEVASLLNMPNTLSQHLAKACQQ